MTLHKIIYKYKTIIIIKLCLLKILIKLNPLFSKLINVNQVELVNLILYYKQ